MKRLRVYGCYKKEKLKTDISNACNYFMDWLIPLNNKIECTVTLKKNLVSRERVYGECCRNGKGSYTIWIDSDLDYDVLLGTIAHEFVHVKQFELGELRFFTKVNKWKGKSYSDDFNYDKLPWEIDANILSVALVNLYRRDISV